MNTYFILFTFKTICLLLFVFFFLRKYYFRIHRYYDFDLTLLAKNIYHFTLNNNVAFKIDLEL